MGWISRKIRNRAVRPLGVVALVLAGLLGGAAGAAWAEDEVVTAGEPLGLEPAAGRALVYLVNPGPKAVDVFLDRNPIARLEKKTFVAVQADPGKRVLWGTVEGQTLDFQPGQTYVYQLFSGAWGRQLPVWLKGVVEKKDVRWAPSTAGQRAELAANLAAGEYPFALQSVGELPLRFDHVACGKKRIEIEVPRVLRPGVLTVDEAGITYKELKGSRFEIPIADVRNAKAFAPPVGVYGGQIHKGYWKVVIFRGPEEKPEEIMCTVAESDYQPMVAAIGTAMRRFRSKQAEAAAEPTASPSPQTPAAETAPAPASPVERAARLAEALEAQEEAALHPRKDEKETKDAKDPKAAGKRKETFDRTQAAQLPGAVQEVETYLESHPDDVQAMMLAARLGRLQEVIGRTVESLADLNRVASESRERRERLQAHLDRVLRLEPGNAAAHRLKAQIYAMKRWEMAKDQLQLKPGDFDKAAEHARKAVELDPAYPAAVETLARYLLASGKPLEEAIAILGEVAGKGHPIPVLLNDFLKLPVPPGAEYLAEASRIFGSVMAAMPSQPDPYKEFRFRMYVVPGAFRTVQDFYRRLWPGMDFYDFEKSLPRGVHLPGKTLAQTFAWTPEGLAPTGDKTGILLTEGGLVLLLNDGKIFEGKGSELFDVPAGMKAPYTLLWVISRRPVAEPSPALSGWNGWSPSPSAGEVPGTYSRRRADGPSL